MLHVCTSGVCPQAKQWLKDVSVCEGSCSVQQCGRQQCTSTHHHLPRQVSGSVQSQESHSVDCQSAPRGDKRLVDDEGIP